MCNALIVNHQLGRGLPPKASGDYQTRERVTTILQATRAVLRDSSAQDEVTLLAMLDDVAQVWLDDASLKPSKDPWQQTVPPKEMQLKRSSSRLSFRRDDGRFGQVSVSGRLAFDADFQVLVNGQSTQLPELKDSLLAEHPFLTPHLQLDFRWQVLLGHGYRINRDRSSSALSSPSCLST